MKVYYSGILASGLVLVHIVRTTPINRHHSSGRMPDDHTQTWCDVPATDSGFSPKVEVDPAKSLDGGLVWCGQCLCRVAAHAGLLADVAALLGAKEATT